MIDLDKKLLRLIYLCEEDINQQKRYIKNLHLQKDEIISSGLYTDLQILEKLSQIKVSILSYSRKINNLKDDIRKYRLQIVLFNEEKTKNRKQSNANSYKKIKYREENI